MATELIVLVGPPGSGKSTFAAHLLAAGMTDMVLNLDTLREELYEERHGHPSDRSVTSSELQVFTAEAVERMESRLALACSVGAHVVADATNVSTEARSRVLRMATANGVSQPSAVVFRTPLALCEERNARRPVPARGFSRRVPLDVVVRKHEESSLVTPEQLQGEGFTSVLVFAADGTRQMYGPALGVDLAQEA
jgi:predicted kinase